MIESIAALACVSVVAPPVGDVIAAARDACAPVPTRKVVARTGPAFRAGAFVAAIRQPP
jgi:hypothetical protein